jgi:hypothetical protein
MNSSLILEEEITNKLIERASNKDKKRIFLNDRVSK